MDEDLSIINANTRNEKIKNFLVNNKYKLIFGLIIILILFISFYSYDSYKIKQKIKISDNFNTTILNYNDDEKEKTVEKLIEIIENKDPTYSPLSLYFIIDNNLLTDHKKVNTLFDILIKDTSIDEEIKNLIIYKKALFNADHVQEIKLLNILNPILNSESVWQSHALYLIGEYFYSKEQKEKAKEFFSKIVSLENSNINIKLDAEKRLTRDLSE